MNLENRDVLLIVCWSESIESSVSGAAYNNYLLLIISNNISAYFVMCLSASRQGQ
jgi:hypothetical protein